MMNTDKRKTEHKLDKIIVKQNEVKKKTILKNLCTNKMMSMKNVYPVKKME